MLVSVQYLTLRVKKILVSVQYLFVITLQNGLRVALVISDSMMGFFGSFLSTKVADLTAQVVGIARQDTQVASTIPTTQNDASQQHLDPENTSLNQVESQRSNAHDASLESTATTDQNKNTAVQKPTSLNLPQMGSQSTRQDDTEGKKHNKMSETRQGSTGSQENKRKLARQSVESDETVIALSCNDRLTTSEEINDNHITDELACQTSELEEDKKIVNEKQNDPNNKKQNMKHVSIDKQESVTDKIDSGTHSDKQEVDTGSKHTDTKKDSKEVSDKKVDGSAEEGKENSEGKDVKEGAKKKGQRSC